MLRESGHENKTADEQLIKGFLDGNCDDFNALYERYKRQLYSYLNRLLPGQAALADDIFQQTWIKVVNELPRYKNKEKFLAWIMRIAHNMAIDHFRKTKHESNSVPIEDKQDFIFEKNAEPWRELDRESLSKALNWALDQLSPELKEVFILRQEGIAFKDIAEMQKSSINTVLGRMQYALKNLQELLSEWKKRGELK